MHFWYQNQLYESTGVVAVDLEAQLICYITSLQQWSMTCMNQLQCRQYRHIEVYCSSVKGCHCFATIVCKPVSSPQCEIKFTGFMQLLCLDRFL